MWNDAGGTRVYGEGLEYDFYYTGLTKQRKSGTYNVNFQYDVLGNLTRITDPFNLAVNYTYDSLDRLDTVTVEGKVFDYEFYADGMLKAVNYPTTPGGQAIRSEYTYDNINWLETVVNKVGSQIISQYSYGYDNNGNITSVTENGVTTQYAYDDLNRLAGINRPDGEEITYEYDTRGNRTKLVEDGAGLNTLSSATLGYNNWDELAQFTTGENTHQYKYDPEGLRIKKESTAGTVRYHLDDNGRVVAESNAAGQVTAQNIWGHKALARKVNGVYYYYIYNGHGDVVQILDEDGNVDQSYTYDEWGNILSQTGQNPDLAFNPIRYAGEYYDEKSGLYYLRARYYDPSIGRFISEDSNEGKVDNPLSLNLYTYCENNPVNYVDPSGNAKIYALDPNSGIGTYTWEEFKRDLSTVFSSETDFSTKGNALLNIISLDDTIILESGVKPGKLITKTDDIFKGTAKTVLKAGDKTPSGYILTEHAAKNATKRGFSLTDIDNVIANSSQKYYSYGEVIYCKKVNNYYEVVIKSRSSNNIVSTIGGKTHSLKTINDVEKFLKNSGRTITTIPLD